jgi:hypothetical protein
VEDDLANTEIVESLVAGDSKAILDLLQMVAPEWAEVTVDELQKDPLTNTIVILNSIWLATNEFRATTGKPYSSVTASSGMQQKDNHV